MVAFMRAHSEASFVTGYDHPDYERMRVHQHPSASQLHGTCRWQTRLSTCLTFMTRVSVLQQTAEVLRTFCRGNSDLGLWMALTKLCSVNPVAVSRSLQDRPFVAGSWALSWWHAWQQQLLGPRFTLWAPQPSLCTHMESTCIAPEVDWEAVVSPKGFHPESRAEAFATCEGTRE